MTEASEPIPEDVMQRAREAAREWLHGYGIMTEPYTLAGGDHPAMTSLPEAIARALMEERRSERERWEPKVASLTKERDKLLEAKWAARRHAFASDWYRPGTCMGCSYPREHPIHAIRGQP